MKEKLLQYGITTAIGIAIAFIIMGAKGVFAETDTVQVMQILSDSFFVPGVIIAGFGLLVVASNGGAFDIFIYGAHIFFSLFRRDVTARKYRTFYDFRHGRKDKKRSVSFMLIVGIVLIVIAVGFLIAYYMLKQPA